MSSPTVRFGSSLVAALAVAVFAVPSHAQTGCSASAPAGVVQLNLAQISLLLGGNTVCGRPGTNYPRNAADRFQEEHRAGGELWDYKRGPGHPIDPTERVGSWLVSVTKFGATVTHTYTGGSSFNWNVYGPASYGPGSVYSFCLLSSQHVVAHVVASGSGCSTFPAAGALAQAGRPTPTVTTGRTPAALTTK